MRYKQVKLQGNLVFSAPLAKQELKDASGTRHVQLDLSDVEYIDSTGINMILELHKKLEAKDGSLRLVGVQKGIADTFRLASLDRVMDIVEAK